jgi:hypothetical protein
MSKIISWTRLLSVEPNEKDKNGTYESFFRIEFALNAQVQGWGTRCSTKLYE